MAKIWLTSDTHFWHDKDFIWQARGFNSVQEMNQAIFNTWNSLIQPEDIVYHLGDVFLGDLQQGLDYLKHLNGNIFICLGNHDTTNRVTEYAKCDNVAEINLGYRLKQGKYQLLLTHYPMLVANPDSHEKIFTIHGHTHSKHKFSNVYHAYNVNVDAHNCTPLTIEQIITDIKEHEQEEKDDAKK